jgi:hypothetical protein
VKQRVYRCTRCRRGEESGITREKLMVKKAVFYTMGVAPKIIRSRRLDWLCPACVAEDPDWQKESQQGASEALVG